MKYMPFVCFFALALACCFGATGCASVKHTATGSCTFKPAREEGYGWSKRVVDPDANCAFSLSTPIKKSRELSDFADAFRTSLRGLNLDQSASSITVTMDRVKIE